MTYYNDFGNWADVCREFNIDMPEPDEVLLADYSYEDYEGSAWVVYRNGDTYYQVCGGHCSCYGLEGQFEPEPYETKQLLIDCLKKGMREPVSPESPLGIVLTKLEEV